MGGKRSGSGFSAMVPVPLVVGEGDGGFLFLVEVLRDGAMANQRVLCD